MDDISTLAPEMYVSVISDKIKSSQAEQKYLVNLGKINREKFLCGTGTSSDHLAEISAKIKSNTSEIRNLYIERRKVLNWIDIHKNI